MILWSLKFVFLQLKLQWGGKLHDLPQFAKPKLYKNKKT